jgi:hypothetical protein
LNGDKAVKLIFGRKGMILSKRNARLKQERKVTARLKQENWENTANGKWVFSFLSPFP